MDKTLAEAIVTLKTEFMKRYEGGSHIHEIVPTSSESLSINEQELKCYTSLLKAIQFTLTLMK